MGQVPCGNSAVVSINNQGGIFRNPEAMHFMRSLAHLTARGGGGGGNSSFGQFMSEGQTMCWQMLYLGIM